MIDPLSLSSLQINVYYHDEQLGSATGFIISSNRKLYLVTNWHVLSGRDHDTGMPLDKKNCAIPNRIEVVYTRGQNKLLLPVLNDDNEAKWIEHSQRVLNEKQVQVPIADVALLPIEYGNIPSSSELPVLNLTSYAKDIDIVPALPVSIIGFPFQDKEKWSNNLPIWITGFVASEPNENIQRRPLMYINAAGFKGLSGSPVVVRVLGGSYFSKGGALNIENDGKGYATKFLGIYSGRVSTASKNGGRDDLVICRVWKPEVIQQILNQKF